MTLPKHPQMDPKQPPKHAKPSPKDPPPHPTPATPRHTPPQRPWGGKMHATVGGRRATGRALSTPWQLWRFVSWRGWRGVWWRVFWEKFGVFRTWFAGCLGQRTPPAESPRGLPQGTHSEDPYKGLPQGIAPEDPPGGSPGDLPEKCIKGGGDPTKPLKY